MLDVYKEIVEKIRYEISVEKDYHKVLCSCKRFLLILNNDIYNKNKLDDEYYFVYYDMALSYKKNNKIKESLIYVNKALQYVIKDEYDDRYVKCLWMISECHKELGNLLQAYDSYCICEDLYEKIGNKMLKTAIGFSKEVIVKNVDKAFDYLIEYENILINKNSTSREVTQQNNMLQDMYKSIIEIYKESGKEESIFNLLHNVENEEFKIRMVNTYLVA